VEIRELVQSFLRLLAAFHAKATSQAKQEFDSCREIISKDSNARALLEEAECHLSKNSFLSAMRALDILTARRQFQEYCKDFEDISRRAVAEPHTLVEFIRGTLNKFSDFHWRSR